MRQSSSSLRGARVAASQRSKKQWNRSQELGLVYVKGAVAGEQDLCDESRGMAGCLLRAEFEKIALAADT
jgi:hypothetical protein